MQKKRVVACALPKRGKGVTVYEAAVAHYHAVLDNEKNERLFRLTASSSLLTFGFNRMWCIALNLRKTDGLTHFAMIHDDICAPPGWADVLIDEMDRVGGDLLSVVVPIKDHRGLTSTAIEGEDQFSPRRLTMAEIFERDETFTEPGLLVNTGLWVCRMDAPWVEKAGFFQHDQIAYDQEGKAHPRTAPEDWNFSRIVNSLGGKIFATRKIQVWHEDPMYTNSKVWGSWKTEQGDSHLHKTNIDPPETAELEKGTAR